MFTAFRALNGILGVVMWVLLLAVTLVLMAMLLWLGAAAAVNTAIAQRARWVPLPPLPCCSPAALLPSGVVSTAAAVVQGDHPGCHSSTHCPHIGDEIELRSTRLVAVGP
jgi:hypothetical protein